MNDIIITAKDKHSRIYEIKLSNGRSYYVTKQWIIKNKSILNILNASIYKDNRIVIKNKANVTIIDSRFNIDKYLMDDPLKLLSNKAQQLLKIAEQKAKLIGINIKFESEVDSKDPNKIVLKKADIPSDIDWEVPSYICSIEGNAFPNGPRKLIINTNYTKISSYAFSSSRIKTLILNGHIDTIEQSMCWNCSQLESVEWDCPKVIKANAFSGCQSLKNIDLTTVNYIDSNAFGGCRSLESVKLIGTKHIGENSFLKCSNIKKIYLQDNSIIKTGAFGYGLNEAKVEIVGCKDMGQNLFSASNVRELHIINSRIAYREPFNNICGLRLLEVRNCNTIFTQSIKMHSAIDREFEIEAKIFKTIQSVSNLTLDEIYKIIPKVKLNGIVITALSNIELIDRASFYQEFVRKIAIIQLDNIEKIGELAFYNSAILGINKIESVKYISEQAFAYCILLNTLEIKNCNHIETSAFKYCTGLKKLILSDIQEIDNDAFKNTTVTEIVIKNCKNINKEAFEFNESLKIIKIHRSDTNKEWYKNFITYYNKSHPEITIEIYD